MEQQSSRPGGADDPTADRDATVAEIIAEFSQVFAFVRTRWARYAEEVNPGLKGVGMMVLQVIRRKGPITATELTQMLDMDKAVVSRQVSKLRELGLLEAEASAEDRRVTLLRASEAAQRTLERLHAQNAHAYHERFEQWSAEELEQLREGLHRFNQSSPEPHDGPAHRCTRNQERPGSA